MICVVLENVIKLTAEYVSVFNLVVIDSWTFVFQ